MSQDINEIIQSGHQPLPCPLCGGRAYAFWSVNGEQMFKVGCAPCGLELKAAWYRGTEKPTKDILTLWNTRALPPSSPVADSPTWLPIETAPRNYKTVLVYLGNDAIATGFRSERGWKVDGWNAPAPTHWMPLPSAPSPSAGANKE